jgi:hypothetical protein
MSQCSSSNLARRVCRRPAQPIISCIFYVTAPHPSATPAPLCHALPIGIQRLMPTDVIHSFDHMASHRKSQSKDISEAAKKKKRVHKQQSSEHAGVAKKDTDSRLRICSRVALFSVCWMITALSLKLVLEPSLEGKIFDIFVQVLFCVWTLAVFDISICCKSPARWFVVHALGNFIIVYFSIADTVSCTASLRFSV